MAEIVVAFTVTGKKGYTICLQDVVCIGNFLQCILLVQDVGQGCEKAIFLGLCVPQLGSIFVCPAGEFG